MNEQFSFKVPRELRAVRQAAEKVRKVLTARNLPADFVLECELALVEACNNAIQHGAGKAGLCVDLSVGEAVLEMRVWDEGPAFELPSNPQLPPQDAERGRGLFLIHQVMDSVRIETSGGMHCLAMRKSLPASPIKEISR